MLHAFAARRRVLVAALSGLAAGRARGIDLPSLIERTKPSICAVGGYDPVRNPRFDFRGTGFAVGDGSLIATCWHVLPERTSPNAVPRLVAQLPLAAGGLEIRDLEVLAADREHDLALLRLAGPPLPALALADPQAVREGMPVAFLGFPIGGVLGFRPVTHRGIVSSIVASALPSAAAAQLSQAAVRRLREGAFELLQLDATAYPGNSGGPLLDADTGRVIGVISMVLVKGTRESAISQPTGISYAVPVRYVAELLNSRPAPGTPQTR